MGFLGVPFVGRGGVGKITSRLKLVIIMLETWNLVRMYTHISFNTRNILILLMSASFGKNQHFVSKIVRLFKAIVWELCNKFFSYIFSFCKIKGYYYWKCKFYNSCVQDLASKLLQIGYKLEKWQLRQSFPKIDQVFLTLQYFSCQVYLLAQVSCQYHDWSYESFCL